MIKSLKVFDLVGSVISGCFQSFREGYIGALKECFTKQVKCCILRFGC